MTKTVKERVREYRQRLKEDPEKYDTYKKNDASRKKRERGRKKLTKKEICDRRAKCRMRVRRHRSAKITPAKSTSKAAYSKPQSLGKAISRVRRALPYSPRKKRSVLSQLMQLEDIPPEPKPQKITHNQITPEITKTMRDFYQRDDISRQAPGVKDFITVREDGKKTTIQKRHLAMTVQEAYQIYKEEHPDKRVGKSKFASERPQHVMKQSETPRNVCLCRYHENINLQLQTLHKKMPNIFPLYTSAFPGECVCDDKSYECMYGECAACGEMQIFTEKFISKVPPEMLIIETAWMRWETSEGRMVRVEKQGTLEDLLVETTDDLPKFLVHSFVKRKQSQTFESEKNKVKNNDTLAVLQVDFAENYAAEWQDEVQSAHWHQKQITVFTAMSWGYSHNQSFALVTDNLDHDKFTVNCYITYLLSEMKEMYQNLQEVHIFSDGAASQFKNKYIFQLLCHLQEKLKISLAWHYFATSHGKGAVDGIGGSVKRMALDAVRSRKSVITSAKSFVSATKSEKMKLVHISEELIDGAKEANDLPALWNSIATLPGTQSAHFFVPQKSGSIAYKPYSSAPNDLQKTHQLQALTSSTCKEQEDLEAATETDSTEEQKKHRNSRGKSSKTDQERDKVDDQQTVGPDDTDQLTNGRKGDDKEDELQTAVAVHDFVAVRVKGSGKKASDQMFVAKIDSERDDHYGLSYMVRQKDLFTWPAGEEQIYSHPKEDIIAKLEQPKIVMLGSRIFFDFDISKAEMKFDNS